MTQYAALPQDITVKRHMTPAHFDTRRRSLGLSVDETADLCGVQDRTVRRWQSGATPIPDDACAALDQLEEAMAGAVERTTELATDQMAGGQIMLTRYRTADELAHSPHAAGLPLGAHAMLVAWTYDALAAEGFDVGIVWSDAPAVII